MKTASVTELKNGLSGYLDKVQRGHAVVVTEHNRPVAILEKVSAHRLSADLAGQAARGLVTLPRQELNLRRFLARRKARSSAPVASAVHEDREGR
jgi:antitoxin (DNA-binding transcriptional repressor) of toxin-antitoxin stability system